MIGSGKHHSDNGIRKRK